MLKQRTLRTTAIVLVLAFCVLTLTAWDIVYEMFVHEAWPPYSHFF